MLIGGLSSAPEKGRERGEFESKESDDEAAGKRYRCRLVPLCAGIRLVSVAHDCSLKACYVGLGMLL